MKIMLFELKIYIEKRISFVEKKIYFFNLDNLKKNSKLVIYETIWTIWINEYEELNSSKKNWDIDKSFNKTS